MYFILCILGQFITTKMDQVDQFKDNSALNYPKQSVSNSQNKDGRKQMGFEEKNAAVHEEMRRMNQLPANSSYVIHRSRVLNKIMQLLSVQVHKYQVLLFRNYIC